MLVPYYANGRIRLANMDPSSGDRARADIAEEQARIRQVQRCRLYYDGEQYDGDNLAIAKSLGIDPDTQRLPEHERLHAYSTEIQECVDFIADQLGSGFAVTPKAQAVADVLTAAWAATDAMTGGDTADEVVVEPLIREALKVGDYPYEVRWDPYDETCWVEFWESEQVQFVVPSGTQPTKVVRTEVIWTQNEAGQDVQVTERVEYEVLVNEGHGHPECRRATFWDEDEGPRKVEWLGFPVLPWGVLRGHRKSLREFRGSPLITNRAMDNADRYDANEQVAYLIARYNSHGNLVVTGDAAAIELKTEGRVRKDVADVLTFPGGTNAFAIELPTDPQMIEHQRKVTSDAIYKNFGLVRVEPDTINGLGGVSGYALEILNRKTEGTFRRIRRQWKKDFRALIDLVLDVTAYKRIDTFASLLSAADLTVEELATAVPAFWDVDPAADFPERTVEIRMGSGFIVDDVAVRDDYTADLISREEGLRQRGYSDPQIEKVQREIKDEKPMESGTFGGQQPGATGSRFSTGRA